MNGVNTLTMFLANQCTIVQFDDLLSTDMKVSGHAAH